MDASWFEPIGAYCERTDLGFWAEPLNALSNGAFLVAAGAAAWRARRDPGALALAGLVGTVGIGSFLFHTLANRWSLFADVIPIALFIYAYFGLAMRRFFGLRPAVAIGATLAFAGVNLGFAPALDALTGFPLAMLSNGSIDYVPAVLALLGVGVGLLVTGQGGPGRAIVAIGALFLVSLVLRTADTPLCPRLPAGTHFLWHVLNAAVLYLLIVVASAFKARRRSEMPSLRA